MAGKRTLLKFLAVFLVLSLFQVVETSNQKHAKTRVASKKIAKLLPTKFHNDHDELMLADQATGSSYSYSYSYSSENDQSGGDISLLNKLELSVVNPDNILTESGYSYSHSSEDDQSRKSVTLDETEKSENKIQLEMVRSIKGESETEEENIKFEVSADESEASRELEPSENEVDEVNAPKDSDESSENTNELNAADEKNESNSAIESEESNVKESEQTEDEIEIEISQKEAEPSETTNELDITEILLEESDTSENNLRGNEALSISGIETFDESESGISVDDSETLAYNNNMETESMSKDFELMSKWEKFLYEINMELSTDEAEMDIMSFDTNDNQHDENTLPVDDLLLEKTVSDEQLDTYSTTTLNESSLLPGVSEEIFMDDLLYEETDSDWILGEPLSQPLKNNICDIANRLCKSNSRHCQAATRHCKSHRLGTRHHIILPDSYSPTTYCGKTVYCQRGYRGPCKRNEIFTSSSRPSSSRPVSSLRQPTCSCASTPNDCISSQHNFLYLSPYQSTQSQGYCTLRYAHRPCYGYPSNYRYCKKTKECYLATPISERKRYTSRQTAPGPCGADEYFVAGDQSYGYCRCRRPNYVRCPKTNRCFPAYTKGTCPSGKWLVPFGNQGKSKCRNCPCPSLADGKHIYWSGKDHQNERSGCYKSHTQGPCQPGMIFIIDDIITGSSRCVPISRGEKGFSNNSASLSDSLMDDWSLFFENSPVDDVPERSSTSEEKDLNGNQTLSE